MLFRAQLPFPRLCQELTNGKSEIELAAEIKELKDYMKTEKHCANLVKLKKRKQQKIMRETKGFSPTPVTRVQVLLVV